MAVPKKRRSKAKKRTKKACWKVQVPTLQSCTNCGAAVRPHHACSECGYYKNKPAVQIKVKKVKQKES